MCSMSFCFAGLSTRGLYSALLGTGLELCISSVSVLQGLCTFVLLQHPQTAHIGGISLSESTTADTSTSPTPAPAPTPTLAPTPTPTTTSYYNYYYYYYHYYYYYYCELLLLLLLLPPLLLLLLTTKVPKQEPQTPSPHNIRPLKL